MFSILYITHEQNLSSENEKRKYDQSLPITVYEIITGNLSSQEMIPSVQRIYMSIVSSKIASMVRQLL